MPGGDSGCANRRPGRLDMLVSGTVAVHRRRGGPGARREVSSSARVESGGRQGASERVRGRGQAWFGPASTVKAEAMQERSCVFVNSHSIPPKSQPQGLFALLGGDSQARGAIRFPLRGEAECAAKRVSAGTPWSPLVAKRLCLGALARNCVALRTCTVLSCPVVSQLSYWSIKFGLS